MKEKGSPRKFKILSKGRKKTLLHPLPRSLGGPTRGSLKLILKKMHQKKKLIQRDFGFKLEKAKVSI